MRIGRYKVNTKRHLIGMTLVGGALYIAFSPSKLSDNIYSGLRNVYSRIEAVTENQEHKENLSILEKITNESS